MIYSRENIQWVWDDEEERRYREWVKEEVAKKQHAEFSEFDKEEEYRRKLRQEAEERSSDIVRNVRANIYRL